MSVNTFRNMLGLIMDSVTGKVGDHGMVFTAKNGSKFRFAHDQDCCEHVYIQDICGHLSDLVGSPIVEAEKVSNQEVGAPTGYVESYTWTFYRFATTKGSVTVRWLGTSNGYYSEGVSYSETLAEETPEEEDPPTIGN